MELGMNDYDLSKAVEPFVQFVEQLTNWYIRRSRRRFWEDQDTPDRAQAFETLYHVLIELVKIAAPYIPFISETIYQNLRTPEMPESVHLCDFPTYEKDRRCEKLEAEMDAVQIAVSLGHSLRKEHMLKVRQPLAMAHLVSRDPRIIEFLRDQQHLISEELNVKSIAFGDNEGDFVSLKAKPNFRVLGKKLGKNMPLAQKAIDQIDQKDLLKFLEGGPLEIVVEGQTVPLTHEDVQVDRIVHENVIAANQADITIALETKLTDELLAEGMVREIVNKINTMRRDANFDVTDRIKIKIETSDYVKNCFEQYKEYICGEVLAVSVHYGPCTGTEWDLNGEKAIIELEKV